MTWADTTTYIGVAVVVMGAIVQMVKYFKPGLETETIQAAITEIQQKLEKLANIDTVTKLELQVKELATRENTLEGELNVKRVQTETLDKRLAETQAAFSEAMDSMKQDIKRIDQNVREDIQRLDHKLDANHKQIIDLLLSKN